MLESSEERILAELVSLEVHDLPAFFVTSSSARVGGDIDIFCSSAKQFKRQIMEKIRASGIVGIRIEVRKRRRGHVHIDIIGASYGNLIIRLDVHGLSFFPRLGLNANFGRMALARSESGISANLASGNLIANPKDLAIIRLGGYVQSYWTGTDKLHHIDWILSSFSQDEIANLVEEGGQQFIRRPKITRSHPAIELLASLAIFLSSPRVFHVIRRVKKKLGGT